MRALRGTSRTLEAPLSRRMRTEGYAMASANPFSKIVSNRQAAREAKSDDGKHLDASSQGRDGHATTQTPPPDANAGVSHAAGSATTPAHAAGAAVAEAAG